MNIRSEEEIAAVKQRSVHACAVIESHSDYENRRRTRRHISRNNARNKHRYIGRPDPADVGYGGECVKRHARPRPEFIRCGKSVSEYQRESAEYAARISRIRVTRLKPEIVLIPARRRSTEKISFANDYPFPIRSIRSRDIRQIEQSFRRELQKYRDHWDFPEKPFRLSDNACRERAKFREVGGGERQITDNSHPRRRVSIHGIQSRGTSEPCLGWRATARALKKDSSDKTEI